MELKYKEYEKKHKDGWTVIIIYFMIRKILGPLVRLIWIKKVNGIEKIPVKDSAILAFNHSSFFDFLCFVAVSPRNIHYLAAEKFFNSLLWRPIMNLTGQIEVKRSLKDKRVVHNKVYCHLRNNKLIGIFPEGTRSPDGELGPAFRGVAFYATQMNVPVIPVGLKGTYEVMSRNDKTPKIKKIIEINVGDPISFKQYSRIKLNKKAHQILTDKVMFDIAKLSEKIYIHSFLKNNYKKR